MKKENTCPDCGAPLRYYHSPEVTRVVCSKHCKGWKVIEEIERKNRRKQEGTDEK